MSIDLRLPTIVGDTVISNGVSFISWDGVSWDIYKVNLDNSVASDDTTTTEAELAQLIAQANPVPTGNGTVLRGTWLSHTDGTVIAYRLILSTGSSLYSLVQPT